MSKQSSDAIQLVTWNINGWRSACKKGLLSWLHQEKPDICCLQEIRLSTQQINDLQPTVEGYYCHFIGGDRPGYSGTAILSRIQPHWTSSTGYPILDIEGRTMAVEFSDFIVVNAYVPNGNRNETRLMVKHQYLEALKRYALTLSESGKSVVICGDFNTAHTPLDLAQRPTRVVHRSGFLPSERTLMDAITKKGWSDSFRALYPNDNHSFTWWAAHADSRARNMGWRFDYVFVPNHMVASLCAAYMYAHVQVSDHCPFAISFRETFNLFIDNTKSTIKTIKTRPFQDGLIL
jgi:exodeoxyribonuclease III